MDSQIDHIGTSMQPLQSESLSSSSESQIVRGVLGVKGYRSKERYERSRGF